MHVFEGEMVMATHLNNNYKTVLDPVHISNNVEATFHFVAKNGNNVERVLR